MRKYGNNTIIKIIINIIIIITNGHLMDKLFYVQIHRSEDCEDASSLPWCTAAANS